MAEKKSPITWVEIPVKDLARAKMFYESIFGLKLEESEMRPIKMATFPMSEKEPGASGALVQGKGYVPSHNGALVYFSVDDLESSLEKINKNGGKTLMPKMSIGEWGYIANFEDSEGNRIALHSMVAAHSMK